MSARLAILNCIKGALRARKVTYRGLAQSIGVSEATVKRDLSRGNFSLLRLDQICSSLGLTLSDLTQRPEAAEVITELSDSQERALVSDPKVLLVTYLLVNDWKFQDIVSTFELDENEYVKILLRLDQLKIIEYRPPHRVRKLTARNFSWRQDGPVHRFFLSRLVPEYFQSAFDGPGDALRFVAGALSHESLAQFKASLASHLPSAMAAVPYWPCERGSSPSSRAFAVEREHSPQALGRCVQKSPAGLHPPGGYCDA